MNKKLTFLLTCSLITSMVFTSCIKKKANEVLEGRISLSGAFALYPLAAKWANDFQKLHPGVTIDVEAGGAGKGIEDALNGSVDFGMLSRDVNSNEIKQGAFPVTVARDAIVLVINTSNPNYTQIMKHGMKRSDVIALWVKGEKRTWGQLLSTSDKSKIDIYTRSDACGAAETFAKWLGKKQEDLKGTSAFGDPGLVESIQKDIHGIGMVNIAFAYDTQTLRPTPKLHPIPIDINEDGKISPDENFYDKKSDLIKAILTGKYPSPPARCLYLVSKGKPKGVAKAFLRYILGDGQKINPLIGYISINTKKHEQSCF